MTSVTVAAVDLGASGGRVMAGRADAAGVELYEVYRFPNEPVAAASSRPTRAQVPVQTNA